MKRQLIVFVLASIAPGPASPQSDGNAPLILELPASTRALGLGGAFVLSSATADGLFYNPALANSARGFGIDVQRIVVTGQAIDVRLIIGNMRTGRGVWCFFWDGDLF